MGPSRAELAAFLSVVRRTKGRVTICSDRKCVVDGFREGKHRFRKDGENMDLWGCLGRALETRQGFFGVRKVKGVHKDDPEDFRGAAEMRKRVAGLCGEPLRRQVCW